MHDKKNSQARRIVASIALCPDSSFQSAEIFTDSTRDADSCFRPATIDTLTNLFAMLRDSTLVLVPQMRFDGEERCEWRIVRGFARCDPQTNC